MVDKIKVEIDESDPTVIIINNRKFRPIKQTVKKIDGIIHRDKVVYKEINEDEFKKNLDLLVNIISEKTNAKELLREILKNNLTLKTINTYLKQIEENKVPIKKHYGCLGFQIGKLYLPIVE